MRVVLFYIVVIAFSSGIFLRSFVDFGLPEISFFVLLSFGVGLVWRRGSEDSSSPHLLFASVAIFLFALGALRLEWASWSETNPQFESLDNTEVQLDGVVVREPDKRETTTHLYVATEDEILLVTTDRYANFEYGDAVEVQGLLSKPESFETDLGRTFNYPSYLKARDVNYMVRFANVSVTGKEKGNIIISQLLQFKHAFMRTVESLLPEPHVGLGEGLLLGVKRALGEELEETFRKTGIIHIVVLSGYNVMLVVIFVTYLLSVVMPKKWQMPFGLVAIGVFALIVGLSATVVRASIMAGLYLIARSTNRTYLVMRALMLAGVVMLILNPYLLAFDTGFQLSFVATMGLILVGPYIEGRLTHVPNSFIKAREFLTATLATQIFVLPILLYQIGEFSVVSVLVNVLVLPMVPIAMFLTFITGIVGFFSTTLAGVLALFTYFSLAYILVVAEFFAALPFASYVVPAFPFWVVVVSYGALGYVLWRLWKQSGTVFGIDELAGWVIEEEEEVRKRIAAGQSPAATKEDTPIFFR